MEVTPLELNHGSLRFSATSCGDGVPVILLHGFPDTLHSWAEQQSRIAASGYRAIAVATRGYEPASQPEDRDYSLEALASDVIAWLDQLGIERAHLVGHDWGAAVGYAVGRDYPERLLSLSTLAVPHSGRFLGEIQQHPRQLRLSWYMGFFQLRGISDYIVRRNDFAFLRKLWRDWSPNWRFSDADFQPVKNTFSQPGVLAAALAYYRGIAAAAPLTQDSRERARWIINSPTLAITGADDGCIDTDVFQAMMHEQDFPQGLQVEQVIDAGHFPHLEQPRAVTDLLLQWFGAREPAN